MDRDVYVGPVGRNWLRRWFQTLNQSFTFYILYLYADNSQLYVSFASGDSAAALNGLQSCLASVLSWMSMNKLKLNPDKTEFLLIRNERQQCKCLSMFPIELFGVKTNPAKSARNLGVILDENFNFHSHISAVCSSCFYHMRDLQRIHRHLDLHSTTLLATVLVSSRLDYCNSLFGTADTDVTKLQRIQNRLASFVTKSPPFPTVFPCFVPFIGCQSNLEYCSRSVCWPTKCSMKSSLLIFTPCLPHNSHPVHWHQAKYIVCQSLGSRHTHTFPLLCPVCLEQPADVCLFSHFSCYLQETSEDTSPWLGLSPFRHQLTWQPTDALELLHRFCYGALIHLSYHWAWLRRGYWRYRNLTDWLITSKLKI